MDIASKAVRAAGGLAVCAVGGAALAALHTPLPWMIGSMLGMAIARMIDAGFEPLRGGRDAGLAVVGTVLGLHFTAPVVHEVSTYWPWFVALGFAAIGFGTVSGLVLERLSGIDRPTAYFGMMPGGASEMAMMGERHGAAPDRVAFAHSMRMLLVVTSFPVAITLAGFHATDDYHPVAIAFDAPKLALLFTLAACGGWVARRLGLPTAYMMGSLIVTTALTVSDVSLSSVPRPFSNAAQVLLEERSATASTAGSCARRRASSRPSCRRSRSRSRPPSSSGARSRGRAACTWAPVCSPPRRAASRRCRSRRKYCTSAWPS